MKPTLLFLVLILPFLLAGGTCGAAPAVPDQDGAGEVWIARRADGVAGTGTRDNPFDGSTRGRFDQCLFHLPPHRVIHIGPGVFMTNGRHAWFPKTGWKLLGAGMGITTLRLAELPDDGDTAYGLVMGGLPGSHGADDVEVADMTLDTNCTALAPKPSQGLSGVCLSGSRNRVHDVEVLGVSSSHQSPESWGIVIGPQKPGDVGGSIADCVVRAMDSRPGRDVQSEGIAIGVGTLDGGKSWYSLTGAIIKGNFVDGGYFAYQPAGYGTLCTGNVAIHSQLGVYWDTGIMSGVIISNNSFMVSDGGVLISSGFLPNHLSFLGNTIVLTGSNVRGFGFFGAGDGLLIANNTVVVPLGSEAVFFKAESGWKNVLITGNSANIPIEEQTPAPSKDDSR